MHPCMVPCSTMCSSMYTNRSTYTYVTLDNHFYFSVYLGMLFHMNMLTCMWYHVHMCGYVTDTYREDSVLPVLLQWPEKAELQDRIHSCSSGWSTSDLMWYRGDTAGCRQNLWKERMGSNCRVCGATNTRELENYLKDPETSKGSKHSTLGPIKLQTWPLNVTYWPWSTRVNWVPVCQLFDYHKDNYKGPTSSFCSCNRVT